MDERGNQLSDGWVRDGSGRRGWFGIKRTLPKRVADSVLRFASWCERVSRYTSPVEWLAASWRYWMEFTDDAGDEGTNSTGPG